MVFPTAFGRNNDFGVSYGRGGGGGLEQWKVIPRNSEKKYDCRML